MMYKANTIYEQKGITTKKLILTALFAALTCISTMVIQIPTSTMGYIHPGDSFVLLSGILLGPLSGAFAAGFGSSLADLFTGYLIYAPATFVIKAGTALIAYHTFRALDKILHTKRPAIPQLIVSGIAGELLVVVGYFVFEIFMLTIVNKTSLYAGFIAALASLPTSTVQGSAGIFLATLLHPILSPFIHLQRSQSQRG